MFTGIIANMGKLIALEKQAFPTLTVAVNLTREVKIGDSIAVNGACLTVLGVDNQRCRFNLSQETLRLSNFGDLAPGSYLNIELPLTMKDFLSGHLVSGHLDGTVRLKTVERSSEGTRFSFIFQDRDWRKFLVHKGSVALNGVSLTITEVKESFFSVVLIPHTLDSTNFKYLRMGERVNIELDLIGKYLYNIRINI